MVDSGTPLLKEMLPCDSLCLTPAFTANLSVFIVEAQWLLQVKLHIYLVKYKQ